MPPVRRGIPGAGPCGDRRRAADQLHLTWVRRLARLAQVPLALHNARKINGMRSTWARKPAAGFSGAPVTIITGQ
jgi:hypothetical protein